MHKEVDVTRVAAPEFAQPTPKGAWWVAIGAALGMTVTPAALIVQTFGVFIVPISAEFGWGRGPLSSAIAVTGIVLAVALPLLGRMIDRWGVRRVALPLILLLVVNIAAISLTPAVLVVFIVLVGLIGVTGAVQSPVTYLPPVVRWFDRRRGLAVGVAVAGGSIGQMLMPQYAQFLVSAVGWRLAYVGLAAILLVIAIPAVLVLTRNPGPALPSPRRPVARGGDVALPGLTWREALRARSFWLIAVSAGLVGMAVLGVTIHVAPMLIDAGFSAQAAVALLGAVGFGSLVGRFVAGYLYDKFFAPYVGVAMLLLAGVGIAMLASGTTPLLAVILLGLATGAETDLIGFLVSRYIGLRNFSTVIGCVVALFSLGSAIGSWLMGEAYDLVGSYFLPQMLYLGGLLLACVLLLLLRRSYPYPVGALPTAPGTAQAPSPGAATS